MKTIPLFTRGLLGAAVGGLLVLAGCASAGGSPTTDTATDDGAMMKAYYDYKAAWNRHDVPAIMAYYGARGTLNNPNAGGPVSGKALAGWLQATFAAIPDFRIDSMSANPINGTTVADQWVIKGTWSKPFPGGPLAGAKPTGRSFAVPGAGFYSWNNGKIASATHYFDQMSLLTQMGVIPPPGQSPQASAR